MDRLALGAPTTWAFGSLVALAAACTSTSPDALNGMSAETAGASGSSGAVATGGAAGAGGALGSGGSPAGGSLGVAGGISHLGSGGMELGNGGMGVAGLPFGSGGSGTAGAPFGSGGLGRGGVGMGMGGMSTAGAGNGGAAGSAGAAGAGGCTPDLKCMPTAPSTGDIYADCVARVNQFRACDCLPPLQRWMAGEACANQDASYDAMNQSMGAHAGFKAMICAAGNAQDECPGWRSNDMVISGCLQQMFNEGPGPTNPCTGTCYEQHGHFINMTNTRYTMVACGYYTASNGQIWAVQNFK